MQVIYYSYKQCKNIIIFLKQNYMWSHTVIAANFWFIVNKFVENL